MRFSPRARPNVGAFYVKFKLLALPSRFLSRPSRAPTNTGRCHGAMFNSMT
jgi:hypothetical protein